MRKIILPIFALALAVVFDSCSSVKVLDSWKGDNASTMRDKNILVVARTNNPQARYAFEDAITAQLIKEGFKATESYKKFPKLNPDKKPTEEKQEMIRSILESEGFDGVVISVVKDYQEAEQTTTSGGYNVGAGYYPSYYPQYYGGFYGFYGMPLAYSTWDSGVYMPTTTTTRTVKTFVLQTLVYNLDLPQDKQMVAIVTSKMEDPQKASVAASDYALAITNALKDKK
ncbi:hypothetical protein K8352_13755 [Flavobacteriaceae bacterium F89]|uniref:DUF4136 domain-containing protein n=1 Tax=Cerina litoralis TaxID=2874477 RepID=A0AAE3JQF7_9FLAO|nr:hypothetical protein [Cerina litoralis]MCG2461819.1 hypothetical protein [Cerina litoralis]